MVSKDLESMVWLSIELLQQIMKWGLEYSTLSSGCGVALEKRKCNDPADRFENLSPVWKHKALSCFILCVLTCVHG